MPSQIWVWPVLYVTARCRGERGEVGHNFKYADFLRISLYRGDNYIFCWAFFTTNPTLVDNVTAIPGISDHDSIAQIEFTTKAKINHKKPHKIYKFHQADFKQIQEEMRKFSEQYFNEDPDKNIPSMRTGID